ncbi:MAG: hypothetical protein ACR2KV_10650 [Solirubrobacteraceae bacterium]
MGVLIALGLSLIVIKGRTAREDISLNMAGLLAPVVAVVPTTDVGTCWSVAPNPLPLLADGRPASWVVTNIDNNFYALLATGALGLAVGLILARLVNGGFGESIQKLERTTLLSLVFTGVALAAGLAMILYWKSFYTEAHLLAAILLFAALIVAVISKAVEHRAKSPRRYFPLYSAVAVLMLLGGGVIVLAEIGHEHGMLVLEAYELLLFAVFWIVQTVDNWNEEVAGSAAA